MLNFKKIEIDDIDIFCEFSKTSDELSCETAFVNLLVWQCTYNNMMAVKDGNLFVKSGPEGKERFRLPLGGDLEAGLKEIFDYCGGRMPDFWIPEGKRYFSLPSWFVEKYNFTELRNAFDYIYLQSDLADLPGKKYHSKRNHISAFSRTFDWRYEKINPENLPDVLKCAEKWYLENPEKQNSFLECEKKGVHTILENMDRLCVKGGAIYVGNEVVAFTLASEITPQICDIHIEKALKSYATAYTLINREFAARELGAYKYINREDDMGLEGLRKAKLSYKPEILLKKYYCTPKENG
ncbi:MAG: DUF2156 domain-containing protein [Acutalibacteraceae bacterium]|jgi:hypothetical protein